MENLLDFLTLIKGGREAALAAEAPCPVLVESAYAEDSARAGQSEFRTEFLGAEQASSAVLTAANRKVFLVQKRRSSTFSTHIGVGRTANLDVVIARAGISKFHAYFSEREGETHLLTDKHSTNGTFVDGARLAAGEPVALTDGAEIRFAGHVFTYVMPESLLELLRTILRH